MAAPSGVDGGRAGANPWLRPATLALWAQVAAAGALTLYTVASDSGDLMPVTALRAFLAALVGAWWAALFPRFVQGIPTPETNGTRRALRLLFPWVTALRLSLWLLSFLALSNVGPEVNTVAVTALLTVSLAYALAKNALYGTLGRFADEPLGPGRVRLGNWLNVAAPLALGIGVINLVPVRGLGTAPDLTGLVVYGTHAVLDGLSLWLAYQALNAQALNAQSRVGGERP